MFHLLEEVSELLYNQQFEYAICGGMAIDLYLGYESRKHGDIDIMAYWCDRNAIITYMQSRGYHVYEMMGGGLAHHIININNQKYQKRNIFCLTDDCELVNLLSTEEENIYKIEFFHIGQSKLNFIEFLFNDKDEKFFLYARNKDIKRDLQKAIINNNSLSYLAPELLLLYKSTDIEREGYQQDFELAFPKLDSEQREWLLSALKVLNPEGHKWIVSTK